MKRRYINLLSWRCRLYLILRTRLLQWLVVGSLVCLIALATWRTKSYRLNGALDSLALMESRCAPLQSMMIENQQMGRRLAELDGHQSLLKRLDDEQVPYRLLGLVSHGVQQCSGGLHVQTVMVTRTRENVPSPKPPAVPQMKPATGQPKSREVTVLKLNGVADDNLAISRFVAALRDSGVFAKVDLRSSVGARRDDGRAQSFLVECELGDGHPHTTSRHSPGSDRYF